MADHSTQPAVSPVPDADGLREQVAKALTTSYIVSDSDLVNEGRSHANHQYSWACHLCARDVDKLTDSVLAAIAEREASLRADLEQARADIERLTGELLMVPRANDTVIAQVVEAVLAAGNWNAGIDAARKVFRERAEATLTLPDDAVRRLREFASGLQAEEIPDEPDRSDWREGYDAGFTEASVQAGNDLAELLADLGLSTPTTDPAPALATPLGVGALVRTNHDLLNHPVGDIGLVIGQAKNGPNRYSVMFPGDSYSFSLAAKDLEVVRGLTPQSWWKKQPAAPQATAEPTECKEPAEPLQSAPEMESRADCPSGPAAREADTTGYLGYLWTAHYVAPDTIDPQENEPTPAGWWVCGHDPEEPDGPVVQMLVEPTTYAAEKQAGHDGLVARRVAGLLSTARPDTTEEA